MPGTVTRSAWSATLRRALSPCRRRRYYEIALRAAGVAEDPPPRAAWARVLAEARSFAAEVEALVRARIAADLVQGRQGRPDGLDPEDVLPELRRRWTRVRERWPADVESPVPPRPGRPPLLELLGEEPADPETLRREAEAAPRALAEWARSSWREAILDADPQDLLWVGGPDAAEEPASFVDLDGVVVRERPLVALREGAGVVTLDVRTAADDNRADDLRALSHLLWATQVAGAPPAATRAVVLRLPDGAEHERRGDAVDLEEVARRIAAEGRELGELRASMRTAAAEEDFPRLDQAAECGPCRFRRLCPGAPR